VKIRTNPDGSVDVWVRQSWLDNATRCPEQGRLDIVNNWRSENDLTAIGTAVHKGISEKLLGSLAPIHAIAEMEWARIRDGGIKMLRYTEFECIQHIHHCLDTWERGLRHLVRSDQIVGVEKQFEFPMFEASHNGHPVRVHGQGTIDVVTKTSVIDWKTASRRYNAKEKQTYAVQPTMYSMAAVELFGHDYPVQFQYGVMIRGAGVQVVDVTRDRGHVNWMRHQIEPFVRMALTNLDSTWPLNDTHYLCNATWCMYYAICKGAYITEADNTPVSLRTAA
jgi:hypothetical protein